MTSIVARLRVRMARAESHIGMTMDEIDTLLTIVERFALAEPVETGTLGPKCIYCGSSAPRMHANGEPRIIHRPGCIWEDARSLSGMDES